VPQLRRYGDLRTPGTVIGVVADIDIADETFIVAAPAVIAARVSDPALWRAWWPELTLTVEQDRGVQGLRWSLSGKLSGTAEIWLEPWRDGVIVHWFVRATDAHSGQDGSSVRESMIRAHKRRIHALKDEIERTRPAGMPREPSSGYAAERVNPTAE
jgi:hypothetical protein